MVTSRSFFSWERTDPGALGKTTSDTGCAANTIDSAIVRAFIMGTDRDGSISQRSSSSGSQRQGESSRDVAGRAFGRR